MEIKFAFSGFIFAIDVGLMCLRCILTYDAALVCFWEALTSGLPNSISFTFCFVGDTHKINKYDLLKRQLLWQRSVLSALLQFEVYY